jgi:V8-like Glu-specific endopeptidase
MRQILNHSTLKKTILKKWKLHESLDVAVFEVDRPIGEDLGWASLRELTNSEVMETPFEISVAGYSAYKRFLSYYTRQEKDMFTMRGPVLKIIKDSIYYDVDTSGGQSGSGITKFENNTLESYGVHYGNQKPSRRQ